FNWLDGAGSFEPVDPLLSTHLGGRDKASNAQTLLLGRSQNRLQLPGLSDRRTGSDARMRSPGTNLTEFNWASLKRYRSMPAALSRTGSPEDAKTNRVFGPSRSITNGPDGIVAEERDKLNSASCGSRSK